MKLSVRISRIKNKTENESHRDCGVTINLNSLFFNTSHNMADQ